MKTKIIQILFMIVMPVIMLSCNQPDRSAGDNDGDSIVMDDNSNNAGAVGNDNDRDLNFIEEAASGGMMEVELGRYAQQNAQSTRVRNFGAMMVKDHTKANDELKAIAASKGINIPATMEESHLNKVNDIKEKRGADFDKEYIKEMVDDHEKDVDKFKKFAEEGTDPDLKTFAAKTLPILLMHQDSAKKINDAFK